MTDKHTPGPWVGIVDGVFVTDNPWSIDHCDDHDHTCAAIGDANGNVVALVVSDDDRPGKDRWDDTELDANGHLIAAAPEMLAALDKILETVPGDSLDEWWVVAVAAVTKARGGQ